MFEKATRLKLRFNYKGTCSVEDLWDIPLTKLDVLYGELTTRVKNREVNSLLKTKKAEDTALDLTINIVKHIVEVRLAEREARKNAKDKIDKKQRLLAIISEKQEVELHNLSVEDLTKMIDKL